MGDKYQSGSWSGSWINTQHRIRMSGDNKYVQLFINGRWYSVGADALMELISGYRDSLRLTEFVPDKGHCRMESRCSLNAEMLRMGVASSVCGDLTLS